MNTCQLLLKGMGYLKLLAYIKLNYEDLLLSSLFFHLFYKIMNILKIRTELFLFQINASSTDDGLNFYDSGHRFEHSQLLLVLLRSLPFAPRALQIRAIQA